MFEILKEDITMKSWRFLIDLQIMALVGCLVGCVTTYKIVKTDTYDSFMREAIVWIGENSDLDTSKATKLPSVVLSDSETINYIWKSRRGQDAPKINAMFSTIELEGLTIYRMYVLGDRSLDSLEHAKTVVHELVHFLQKLNGLYDTIGMCLDKLEPQAYELAGKWLLEQGVKKSYVDAYVASGKSTMECK